MRVLPALCLLLLCLSSGQSVLSAEGTAVHGQVSGWFTGTEDGSPVSQLGLRYIPDLFLELPMEGEYSADAEIAVNAYGTTDFYSWDRIESNADLKPYRLWARFSGPWFEARAGLQKINFGSATLFRPLKWFDRVDPRDPLKLTDGVYALLLRCYFQNNANIWLWGLYGNTDPKGWETLSTADSRPEIGMRLQLPAAAGEIGFSYHYRRADFPSTGTAATASTAADENRIALDGKWDLGIGLWFEGSILKRDESAAYAGLGCERMLTLGADYTFNVGNGLSVLGEVFHSDAVAQALSPAAGTHFAGISVSYPISLLDGVSGIYYRDLTTGDNYYSLMWQRTYDNWVIYLIGFLNPETDSFVTGNGIRLMIVFNH